MDALREGSAPYNRDAKAECPDTTTLRSLASMIEIPKAAIVIVC
jgi:hypothetical protein